MQISVVRLCALSLVALATNAAAVTIETVPVGNPNNISILSGWEGGVDKQVGSVAYDYRIAKTEVTNSQYAEFLNAKAASDPYSLYSVNMGNNPFGGISRTGSAGSYSYAARTNMGNKPVGYLTFYDAVRFANWVNNGQGSGDTESGAYTLLGGTRVPTNAETLVRNSGATWFLPSEDEWFKAAYFDPTLRNGLGWYWDYPTASNDVPTQALVNAVGDISNPGPNVVNYNNGALWNGQVGNFSTVGSAGPLSASFYGTLDQGGNAYEWTDTKASGSTSARIKYSGSWTNDAQHMRNSMRLGGPADGEARTNGFRLATIPEPSTIALAAFGLLAFVGVAVRRRS